MQGMQQLFDSLIAVHPEKKLEYRLPNSRWIELLMIASSAMFSRGVLRGVPDGMAQQYMEEFVDQHGLDVILTLGVPVQEFAVDEERGVRREADGKSAHFFGEPDFRNPEQGAAGERIFFREVMDHVGDHRFSPVHNSGRG
jgi:hypothetical protein